MVVLNSVSHDARVIKEAETLSAAGHKVTIYGIQDVRDSRAENLLPAGTRIVRVPWQEKKDKLLLLRGAAFTFAAGTGLFCLLLLGVILNRDFTAAVQDIVYRAVGSIGPLFILLYVVGVLFFALATVKGAHFMLNRYASYDQSKRNRKIGAATAAQPSASAQSSEAPRSSAVKKTAVSKPPKVKAVSKPSRLAALMNAFPLQKYLSQYVFYRIVGHEIRGALKKDAPGIVHCHDLNSMPIGVAHKRETGCELTYDSHEIYEELSLFTPFQRWYYARLQRQIAPYVDRFITVNDHIADFLTAKYPALPEAVVIRNATFPAEVVPADGRLHRAAGLESGTRILLYQGGFARFRGLDVLVRSGPLLPEGWVLVMMGWGAYESALRSIAHEVDPQGTRIRFIPPAAQSELPLWTSGASLGAIPYENVCLNHWFCSPNKLWEYPNAGVPILASPFPVLKDAVEECGIGMLLDDPVTAEGIAAAVARFDEGAEQKMVANCRAFIARDNWHVYAERLLKMYEFPEVQRRAGV
nr:glycosyltransferase family 4 protein [Desulfovibrio sp. JC010]